MVKPRSMSIPNPTSNLCTDDIRVIVCGVKVEECKVGLLQWVHGLHLLQNHTYWLTFDTLMPQLTKQALSVWTYLGRVDITKWQLFCVSF